MVHKPEKKRDHYDNLCINGGIILKWIVKKWEGVDEIYVAQVGTPGGFL
jgi:hypothetical protein